MCGEIESITPLDAQEIAVDATLVAVRAADDLRNEDSWQRETGRSSKTLAKYPDFRIVLVLMKSSIS